MRSILTILKSPLIWRIMISVSVLLLLRELKAIHKDIGRMEGNQSLSRQEQLYNGTISSEAGIMGLWQNNLTEVFPELRKATGKMSAASTLSFEQDKQIIARLYDSIACVPKSPVATSGSIHYSHTIKIER